MYVENIQQHDILMGSDMTRRRVTAVYPLDWAHPSPMYQINAMGSTDRIPPNAAHTMPFVVTADHILVMRIDSEPGLSCTESRNQYTVQEWSLPPVGMGELIDGVVCNLKPFKYSHRYNSRAEAVADLPLLKAAWQPLVFRATAQWWYDNIIHNAAVQHTLQLITVAKMYRPAEPRQYAIALNSLFTTMIGELPYMSVRYMQDPTLYYRWLCITYWKIGFWLEVNIE
jgi:hypothetical protein